MGEGLTRDRGHADARNARVLGAPPLWSNNIWGDSLQAKQSREHERALLAGETTERFPKPKVSHEALRRIDDIEGEMRKKLAAMANFNEPERAMLLKAFRAVDVGQPHGLVTPLQFSKVWRGLGVSSTRLDKPLIEALFLKYGMDTTGRLPYDMFVSRLLETPGRRRAQEVRQVGPFVAGGDYSFKGRIKYMPCRKGVYTPTDLTPATVARSAKLPKAGLSLEHVYGYAGVNVTAPNVWYTDTNKIVYYTAAVGVVYDPINHTQRFFFGHDDDIKCLAIHPARRLVASGQVASTSGCPYICLWDTHERVDKDGTPLLKGMVQRIPLEDLESGGSMRAVIALAFSADPEGCRLACVTADNDHTVTVFNLHSATADGAAARATVMCRGTGSKGTPPTVWGVVWNPFAKSELSKRQGTAEFVTFGVKHVKLWRLCRDRQTNRVYYGVPGKGPGTGEGGRFASLQGMAPDDVLSAEFIPTPAAAGGGGGSMLVTGAKTGAILLWSLTNGLECRAQIPAHAPTRPLPGCLGLPSNGVRALCLRDDQTLLSGGSDGKIIPWSVMQLTGNNPAKAMMAAGVIELPPLSKNAKMGDVYPSVLALHHKAGSAEVLAGTHGCDVWAVGTRRTEPVIYGHSAYVNGLAFHPTKPAWFVTASEASRIFVWDAHKRCLLAKRNVHRQARSADFSPDGSLLAVGGKDGSFTVLKFSKEMEVVTRPDGSAVDIKHCVETIDAIKFSPDGARLAVGSHDNFIDIYDTAGDRFTRLGRCQGHSSYITQMDWSVPDPKRPDYRVLQSTDGAYELLQWDGNTAQPYRGDLRDERWATFTCTLGFPVMGVWPKSKKGERAADGTDINALCRGKAYGEEYVATADDSGKIKLFNYPCVIAHAPFRAVAWKDGQASAEGLGYTGHSSHVTSVRFSPDGRRVVSIGGHDQAVFQWRIDPIAKEQVGAARREAFAPVLEAPVIIAPPKAVMFAPDEDPLDPHAVQPRSLPPTFAPTTRPTEPHEAKGGAAAMAVALRTECEYVVTVHTSDVRGAGTDANVFLSLTGKDAQGKPLSLAEVRLDNARNNFERGMVDEFQLRGNSIGTLSHARIRHDNSGLAAGWHLHKVVVHNKTEGWQVELSPQDVWLDASEGDGAITRTLFPLGADGAPTQSSTEYTVSITTSDLKGAGTDANVFIILFGTEGDSGKRVLDTSKNNFERGMVDVFKVKAHIGRLERIRIGHDGKGFGAGWHLQDVAIHTSSEPPVHFDLPITGRWFDVDEDDGQIERDLYPVGKDGKPTSGAQRYKITVYTSDVKWAGTDANVSIELRGEKGNSGLRKLASSKNDFERGAIDEFFVEAPDLGALLAIDIGHDNRGIGAGWHLNKVVVENVTTGTTAVFPAGKDGAPGGRWFADNDDDRKCRRLLTARSTSEFVYTVTVYTSDIKYAGTDADVFVTLFGEKDGAATSSPVDMPLATSKNNFERNMTDVFDLPAMPDLGELTKVRIGHNGKGLGAGWHCDHVEVYRDTDPDHVWYFPCGNWFDKGEPPNQIVQTLPVAVRDVNAAVAEYKITVYTSDIKYAGTDANVSCTVFGDKGDTGSVKLSNSKNNFERNMADVFTLRNLRNVGAISHLTIGHDNSLMGAAWHLREVEVMCVTTGETVLFPADRWFATDIEPYETTQTLYPLKDGQVADKSVEYKIDVYTSDIRFAGTDANVKMKMFGELEDGTATSTAEMPLDNSKNNFERNQHDVFIFKKADLGKLTKIQIGHDSSLDAWHLARVEVTKMGPVPERTVFPCDRWLDKKTGLTALLTPEAADSEVASYKVVVFTSDIRSAGTDANVTIRMFGEDGTALEEMPLESSKNDFERNCMDEFTLRGKNVKRVAKIDIGHDGKWLGSGWHLNKVQVTNLSTNDSTFFVANRWLDSKNGKRVTLEAGSAADVEHSYEVTVHTSDLRGSGTDANVSIVVYGDKGDSGERKLDNSANNFERAAVDVFHFTCKDLGVVDRIQIGHDNSGFGPGWHCKLVEVTDTTTSATVAFPCNAWFDKKQPPHQTTQTLFPKGSQAELVRYVVTVYTSDVRGAGTDANVSLKLQGRTKEGKDVSIGPMALETSANNFERGKIDVFQIDGIDLGEITRATLRQDGSGFGSAWHVNQLEVTHTTARRTYSFSINQWLDKSNGNMLELTPGDNQGKRQHKYKVLVRTSDVRGAGTDANVSIVIYGTKGDTGERKLDTSANNFERGMEDVFFIECEPLGELQRVRIGHDNKGLLGSGWHLQEVVVTDTGAAADAPPLEREATFLYNGWLDKTQSPYQLSVELTPDGAKAMPKVEEVVYKVTVYTSDRRGAGTDASVFIELHGTDGHVGWQPLEARSSDFSRGGVDEFIIKGSAIGKLDTIGIKHDNKGFGSAWHLQQVEVRNETTGEVGMFPCDKWLDASQGDKKVERQLNRQGEVGSEVTPDSACRYKVTTFTSNKFSAGTDANIFITMKGPLGSVERRKLDHGPGESLFTNKFERNQADTFFFSGPKVAEVTEGAWALDEFCIESDNSGLLGSDWHLGHVTVANATDAAELRFVCDDWLNKKQPLKSWRRSGVYASPAEAMQLVEGSQGVYQYKVAFSTGNSFTAGTDASLKLTLVGDAGVTWSPTLDQTKKDLQRGQTDSFTMAREADLGEISAVCVQLEQSGDQWLLEKVVVTALHSGKEWVFACGQWITTKQTRLEKGMLAKLGAGDAETATASGQSQYELTFYTGSKMGAGTDSVVCCEIVGQHGASGTLEMDTDKKLFSAKGVDAFQRVCKEVGEVSQLRVWRGTAGFGDAWYLEKVTVEHAFTQRKWTFEYNAWVKADANKASVAAAKVASEGLTEEEVAERKRKATEAYQMRISQDPNSRPTSPSASAVSSPAKAPSPARSSSPTPVPSSSAAPAAPAVTASSAAGSRSGVGGDADGGSTTTGAHVYTVTTVTGTKLMSGTDATVHVTFMGPQDSGRLPWKAALSTTKHAFEKGQTDSFRITRDADFGEVAALRVEHDGSGMTGSWYLETVTVTKVDTGRTWLFEVYAWVDGKGVDVPYGRVAAKGSNAPAHETEYSFTFTTGSKFGAGTDALVSVQLEGEQGSFGPIPMDTDRTGKLFNAKAVDTFVRVCPPLGELVQASVWHDGSGIGASWFLETLVVTHVDSQRAWKFVFSGWMANSQAKATAVKPTLLQEGVSSKSSSSSQPPKASPPPPPPPKPSPTPAPAVSAERPVSPSLPPAPPEGVAPPPGPPPSSPPPQPRSVTFDPPPARAAAKTPASPPSSVPSSAPVAVPARSKRVTPPPPESPPVQPSQDVLGTPPKGTSGVSAASRYPIADSRRTSVESADYAGYQSEDLELPPNLPDSEDDAF